MLFSLVILELMDEVGEVSGLDLNLWYLDDGTFAGTRKSVSKVGKSYHGESSSPGPSRQFIKV